MCEIEQSLSANAEFRVLQQLLHLGAHGLITRGRENRERLLPHLRIRMPQQAANGGMNGAPALYLEKA